MKHLLLFCILGLCVACTNKKYDPNTYKVESAAYNSYGNTCLTFMNYCDKNYSSDLKKFVRDYLRTWKEWTPKDFNEDAEEISYRIKRKSKRVDNPIDFKVSHREGEPSYFKAEYTNYFDDAYESLLDMAQQEFGEPDEEKETKFGTICKWNLSDIKTFSIEPRDGYSKFYITYRLDE